MQGTSLILDKSFLDLMTFTPYPSYPNFEDFQTNGMDIILFFKAFSNSFFLLKIKYKYNRPRPYQIADQYGIEDFKRHELDTANTPSYPSGHALQGRLIGLILTDKDPKHQNEYMAVAQKISDSRIMARAHYPSDKVYGEKLADELYDQIIKSKRH